MSKELDFDIPEIPMDPSYTVQDYVYLRLRNAIMLGALQPGTTLTMRGLADLLNLSPTPIREALRRLSTEHAVQVLGNRRMTIPKMDRGRFEELIALRIAIEVHAAIRALPYISDIIVEKLTALDNLMDQKIANDDLDQLTLLNQEFHRILYTANPHQTAMPIVESVWLQLGPFQRQVIKRVSEFYLVDRHKEILGALKSRDATALSIAIENDIRDGTVRAGIELLTKQSLATPAA